MARIEITDVGVGRVRVSFGPSSVIVPFESPVGEDRAEEIRWYLEDFSGLPYGGEIQRAREVEDLLRAVGSALFDQVLGAPASADVWDHARRDGLDEVEIAIRSERSAFFSIPWELAYSGGDGGFLADTGVSFCREHLAVRGSATPARGSGPIRVLLILSRPEGVGRVPVSTVADSLVRIAVAASSRLEVDVLRPPTLENLRFHLAREPDYDIVHFDGHGEFPSIADTVGLACGAQGYLLFETSRFRPDPISGEALVAAATARPRAPLFILNACKSARDGNEQPLSSVASQLLRGGSPAVVAMSYAVRVDAVEAFMREFYRSLVEGLTLERSMAKGRGALMSLRRAPEAVQDWFVPVLFYNGRSTEIDFTEATVSTRSPAGSRHDMTRLLGRGEELLIVERALAAGARCVVVRGVIGSGKSEFCHALAEWLTATGAMQEAVVIDAHDCAVSEAIDRAARGLSRREAGIAETSRDTLLQRMSNRRLLIVWDHAERMLADTAHRDAVHELERAAASSGGRILLTTYGAVPGEWDFIEVPMGDLSDAEASRRLAAAIDVETRKRLADHDPQRFFRGLFMAASYHARTLDNVIRAFSHQDVSAVERAVERLEWGAYDGCDDLLSPRVEAAFRGLGDRARAVLPILGLFGYRVQLNSLAVLTNGGLTNDLYLKQSGTAVTADEWAILMTEAKEVGLVEPSHGGVYEVDPTVRLHLRRALGEDSPEGDRARGTMTAAVVGLYVALCGFWRSRLGTPSWDLAVRLEEPGILRAIRAAVSRGMFLEACEMVSVLSSAWLHNGQWRYLSDMAADVAALVGPGFPGSEDEMALWAELRESEASHALAAGDHHRLGDIDRGTLERLGEAATRFSRYIVDCHLRLAEIAVSHGTVLQAQDHLDHAGRASRGLASHERDQRRARIQDLLDRKVSGAPISASAAPGATTAEPSPQMALEHEQRGIHSLKQRDPVAAHDEFAAATRIWARLGRTNEMTNARSLLADSLVAQGRVVDAIRVYREVVVAQMESGQSGRAANTALLIGQALEQAERFDEARSWCESAIPAFQRHGMQLHVGHAHHELAIIALLAPENDQAEGLRHIQAAIDIYRGLQATWHEASSLLLLGQIELYSENPEEACRALRRSRDLAPTLGPGQEDANRELLLARAESLLSGSSHGR